MISIARILLVDDESMMIDAYRLILEPLGYELAVASSAPEARAMLSAGVAWDVVVLDKKLEGNLGPDSGLDLLHEIAARAPMSQVIVVTGYAEGESVKRAFAAGVYDYLEKNPLLSTVLPIKVQQAIAAPRERRLAVLVNGAREKALREQSQALDGEPNSQRKGRLLEDLVALLFKSIRGFESARTSWRSVDQEIDLVLRNESSDEYWRKQSPLFLGECKRWSKKVDPKEFVHFHGKLRATGGQARVGFFVATGGFTAGFATFADKLRLDDIVVVPIDGDDLRALVDAGDARNDLLKALHTRAVLGASR